MNNNKSFLSVKDLTVYYDNIKAVDNISFEVFEGEIVTLIGGNGAGKSTTLRAISGIIPYIGAISFNGLSHKKVSADKIVAMGIAHVPEGRGIFGNLTVLENLKLATWGRKNKNEIKKDFERVFSIFPRLKERMYQMGTTLSGGEQQMLAVARALMSRGRMLLLDEPSMGLSPVLVREIFRILIDINKSGVTILLVEQNAHKSLEIANRGYVMEAGSIVLSGSGHELSKDHRVIEAYLGG